MATAKVFMSGQGQAVRLPKEFRINADEVNIKKVGESIVLTPVVANWDNFFSILGDFEGLQNLERNQPTEQQVRESLGRSMCSSQYRRLR
jgi:antitoxin VapB